MIESLDANYNYLNLDRFIEQANFYLENCANDGNIKKFKSKSLKNHLFPYFYEIPNLKCVKRN